MKIEAFLIADAATDSQGKLNVLGAFDTIYVSTLPAVHLACAIAIRLRLSPEEEREHDLEISIKDSSNEDIVPPLKGKFGVRSETRDRVSRVNLVLNLQSLNFEEFGEYKVILSIDGEPFSSIPFYVTERQQDNNSESN